MGNNKRKKTAATAGAVALTMALVLTGTYAWRSISQTAKNENTVYTNPGGRLHDDWQGDDGVKNVYVENFTENTCTDALDGTVQKDSNAAQIYVRVKLQTYMEFGEEAGKKTKYDSSTSKDEPIKDDADWAARDAQPLVATSKIQDTTTWPAYDIYNKNSVFDSYISMTDGTGSTVKYMPTFNKNKESLEADVNGTYDAVDSSTGEHFDDYIDWSKYQSSNSDQKLKQDAYYYAVTGQTGYTAGLGINATIKGTEKDHRKNTDEEHEVSETLETVKIITMEQWLALPDKDKTGNFWVYDDTETEADGGCWAYWANYLDPGDATGPLLTGAKLRKNLGQNCYYAINVVSEFASAGDWGSKADGTGFYENGITDSAITLLNKVADTIGADYVNVTATSSDGSTPSATGNSITVNPGATVTFSGDVTLLGTKVSNQEIKWKLDPTSKSTAITQDCIKNNSDGTATLTIPSDAVAQTLKITATPTANPDAVVTYKVKIKGPESVTVTNQATSSADTVKVALGGTATYTAIVDNGTYGNQNVVWDVKSYDSEGNEVAIKSTIAADGNGDGVLTVASDEVSGTILTVIAKSEADENVLGTAKVRATNSPLDLATLETIDSVKVTETGVLTGGSLQTDGSFLGSSDNTEVITIGTGDSGDTAVSFYVIAKKDGKALLLSQYRLEERAFYDKEVGTILAKEYEPTEDESTTNATITYNRWKYSTARAYLNGTDKYAADSGEAVAGKGWLSDKSTLATVACPTELTILREFDSANTAVDATSDQIFYLSEADIFGSTASLPTEEVLASYYTVTAKDSDGDDVGVKLVAPNGTWIPEQLEPSKQTKGKYWWWLRSPRNYENNTAYVSDNGSSGSSYYAGYESSSYGRGGVRPALWINL